MTLGVRFPISGTSPGKTSWIRPISDSEEGPSHQNVTVLGHCFGLNYVPPKTRVLTSQVPGPQNVAGLGGSLKR